MTFVKPNRAIHTVWIHCSAASRPTVTAAEIDQWHIKRGWAGIGYHYFIRTDGTLEEGRPVSRRGAHVKGYNTGSIGICLNGLKVEDFTEAQFETLRKLCAEINDAYDGAIRFRGHNEVAAKLCPVFDYRKVLNLSADGQIGEDVPVPMPKPEIDAEMTKEVFTPVSQKPIVSVKEAAAAAPAITAVGGFISQLEGAVQLIAVSGLTVALLGLTAVIGYRLIARKNMTR